MKKLLSFTLLALLLMGCATGEPHSSSSNSMTTNDTTSSNSPGTSSTLPTTSATPNPSSNVTPSTSNTPSTSLDSSSSVAKQYTLKELKELGASLEEGQKGERVCFDAMYVKVATVDSDKLMLFVDDNSYLHVRVVGGFSGNSYLDNRYTFCDYHVTGTLQKLNGVVEVVYENLTNIASTPTTYDFEKVTTHYSDITSLNQEFNQLKTTSKLSGVGKIVTFEARVVALDSSDANKKAFVYDGKNTMAIINDKKICSASDIGLSYEFTGWMSVQKSSPAILLLDMKSLSSSQDNPYDFTSAIEMKASEFAKWYYVSDYVNPPSYEDYNALYKITGYVADDDSRTNAGKFYLGIMDEPQGSLSDTGIKKCIPGVYLLNHQGLTPTEVTNYSAFGKYYDTDTKISFYAKLYQFDTQNHGWKVVPLEFTITEVE